MSGSHAKLHINYKDAAREGKKIERKLGYFAAGGVPICLGALIEWGSDILVSAKEMCPIELGNLRNSGYLLWPSQLASKVKSAKIKGTGEAPAPSVMRNYPKGHPRHNTDFVQRLMQQHVKVIAYRRSLMRKMRKPAVEVGFTPWYAAPVHERTDVKHGAGTGPFFLSKAVVKNKGGLKTYVRKWFWAEVRHINKKR